MKTEENDDQKEKKDDLEKKLHQHKDAKNLRKSHLFQVVLEFYVRQIELSFSFN
tara:strand:- start:42 stop:203 length:162 start_codon:yes stop_codon:yes gene_type:complete